MAIGNKVSLFKVGYKVFGYNDSKFGVHAEYMVMEESSSLTWMPKNTSAKINKGQNILINGATGAIGSAAVQLVKYFGA